MNTNQPDAERAAFERAISGPPYERDTARWPDDGTSAWPGNYKDYPVDLAWALWRERAALAPCGQTEPAGKVVASAGGDNDVAMIQWTSAYRPQRGDLIWATPPAAPEGRPAITITALHENGKSEATWKPAPVGEPGMPSERL